MRRLLPTLALALIATASSTALGLTQPNGKTIPTMDGCDSGKPLSLGAVFACVCDKPGVCNIGASCPGGSTSCDQGNNATCETTIWHEANDNPCIPTHLSGLDPVAEASTKPETFRPTCGLTFTIVTRGNAKFKNAFGWYNATGQKPATNELYPMLDCTKVTGDKAVLDVRSDPRYKGGEVGFFIVTPASQSSGVDCAGGNCCADLSRIGNSEGRVFYSEAKYNPDTQAGAASTIHLLVFNSHITQHKFYFAWEDIFGGSDNEFMDLVTSVEGVECSGGGTTCSTGKKGVCGYGMTACKHGATAECVQVFQEGKEQCDGLDNDCNGLVDDNATCPSADDICSNGQCVHKCNGVEFPCRDTATSCDRTSGLCVDPKCVGVSCPSDKVCRGGSCLTVCDSIVCPKGQTCLGNSCVDLCKGKGCAAGQACVDGICFAGCAQCGGLVCDQGLSCDSATGACVDNSCAGGCPSGTHCEKGQCKQACDGVVCPPGQGCSNGQCLDGVTSSPSGDGGASGGLSRGDGAGADGGMLPDGGKASASDFGHDNAGSCSCKAAGANGFGATLPLGLAALLGLGLARRRLAPRRRC